MSKKRALICAILLTSLAVVAFIVAMALPDSVSNKIGGLLTTCYIMFLCGGLIMFIVYARKRKKEEAQTRRRQKVDKRKFEEWLKNFEPFARTGIKFIETHDKTFTKFGGLPDVPENFVWAENDDGKPIPFLLQVDFAEINSEGLLSDFPTKGLMYLFADYDDINDPAFEDGEEPYAQGRTFRILYFESCDKLSPAEKPADLETVYDGFNVRAEQIITYPDIDDCKEAFDIYCDRPVGGMDDEYDSLQAQNLDETVFGGWATYVQGSDMKNTCKPNADDWILLAQIASIFKDDRTIWGDGGKLYFYIRRSELLARKFDNVKMDMQCF